jgi:branched-chain amino acid transport system ATP-binding protein
MGTVLSANEMTVRFGGVTALNNVTLGVEAGTFVGLIGPNGAGKTTFIDAITGFVPTQSGAISLNGLEIGRRSAADRARLGLVRTFQSLELFDDLSVADNLLVAAERPRFTELFKSRKRGSETEPADRVASTLALLELEDIRDAMPSDLPLGRRKLVGVARALVQQPKLLLLDEPAAGLDTRESYTLGRRLRSLTSSETSIFLVDHDMGLVLTVCDYIYVLDFGRLIAQGTPGEIRRDPNVIAAYLGETIGEKQILASDDLAAADPPPPEHESAVER